MENKLHEKYGLFTAISMVVGIVIGSGIFFKAVKVLNNTDGSMPKTLAVVAIVGLIMIICSLLFAKLATRYEKVNGIVDYAEVAIGPKYGYFVAWFMTTIYYPSLTSCLAWVSAQYACSLFGLEVGSTTHMLLGLFFLLAIYAINVISPKLGGIFQVSTTVIKLIPLVLMAVVGTIAGLVNGMTLDAFAATTQQIASQGGGMLGAIVAFAFAYEGWIIATAINAELKNSKKNLPRALIWGAIIVIAVYLLYFVGMTGALSLPDMIAAGDDLPGQAFASMFGTVVGSVIYAFIVVSCLGTTNGLMMGSIRGAYSIAARGRGIAPKTFAKVNAKTNSPTASTIAGVALCIVWFFYWHFCFFQGRVLGNIALPAFLTWEPDELPIITLYGSYVPIFISMMVKQKDVKGASRYILPVLGVLACCFMVYCAIVAYKVDSLYYLAVFAIIMIIGAFFMKPKMQEVVEDK